MTLQIKAYFFDAQLDYLPYYRNFTIHADEEIAVKELLPRIKAEAFQFSYSEEQLYFRVNGLVLDGTQTLKEVTDRLGTSLQIDPVSTYRSTKGLIINDEDFMESFSLLAPYATEEDKAYHAHLYPLHYASETYHYNNQYIGDAVLLLAHKMILENNPNKTEILEAISSHHEGLWECEYENNLFHAEDHEVSIAKLREMAKPLANKYKPLFSRKYKATESTTLEGRHVAFYAGTDEMSQGITESTLEQIESKGAQAIRFDKSNRLAGQTIVQTNPKMAYLKMGAMLLDALDSGADLLVVSSEEDATLFKQSIGYCEKVTQRDIPLEIISRGKLMGMSGKAA